MTRVLGLAVLLLAGRGATPAQAMCQGCDASMFCVSAARGGTLCIGSGEACLMAGRCLLGGHAPGIEPIGVIQLSVLEAPEGLGPLMRSRVLRDVGTLSVGRESARLAREAAGGTGPEPEIVFSGVGSGDGVTAVLRSRQGDGFSLRRDADGRGARVTIRAVHAGHPGMLLARERLEERDVLAVRVTLEGRTRVVLVQAPTLAAGEAEALDREARALLRGASGARPGRIEPPFELLTGDD